MKRTNQNIVYSDVTEQTARFAKSLSHPVRLAILKHLDEKKSCFTGDLVKELQMAQSTISQHIKELKQAGLIQDEILPPRVKYYINQESWNKAKKLFENLFSNNFSGINCC